MQDMDQFGSLGFSVVGDIFPSPWRLPMIHQYLIQCSLDS
jgi:hypothetical protein